MEIKEIYAWRRDELGKEKVKKMRKKGLIPAVLYGAGKTGIPLSVSLREFTKLLHAHGGGNLLLNIRFVDNDNENVRTALIREIQYNPVRDAAIHLDFQEVSMDKEITIRVPVVLTGEAVGVKEQGGIIEMILREIEITCLPSQIPDKVVVDVSALRIGDSILVKDLSLSSELVIKEDPEQAIVTMSSPKAEEEVAPPKEAEVKEPEVLTQKKAETKEEA